MTTATAPYARTVPSGVAIARARVGLELRLLLRDRQAMVFSLLYPVIMMVIFGSVFKGQTESGGTPWANYFLAGIAATGIMLTSFQNVAISIAVERDDGTLARLQSTTMPAYAYFAGKVGMVLAGTVAQLVLLLAVARLAFAVPLPADAGHWLTFAWVALIGSVTGTVIGVAASALPKNGKSANVVIAPIALVLQFFSGVFFAFDGLPGWMRQIASLFPLKWLAQGLRSAVLPGSAAGHEVGGGWEHGETLLVMAIWVIIALVIGVRTFRWRRA